jgi:hypothetical protein
MKPFPVLLPEGQELLDRAREVDMTIAIFRNWNCPEYGGNSKVEIESGEIHQK